jgi:hypothetical protein
MSDDIPLRLAEGRFPLGRRVRFYPVAGRPEREETRIRSVPWRLGHGEIVVKVDGRAGGVSIGHLELIE